MFGYSTGGVCLLAVLAWLWCCGVDSASVSRHRCGVDTQMGNFCCRTQVPVNLRDHLADNLPLLRQDIEDIMSELDRSEIPYIQNDTSFGQNKNVNSLAETLDYSLTNVRCMGRALNIHCPRSADRRARNRCLREIGSALFASHFLKGKIHRQRSRASFQNKYQRILQDLQQLRAAVPPPASAAPHDACEMWLWNPSQVLTYSYASISITQTLVEGITNFCQGLRV